ncbi:hypothetical protein U1Q18_051292, partial [Sarracenia purpurea var. burkii]
MTIQSQLSTESTEIETRCYCVVPSIMGLLCSKCRLKSFGAGKQKQKTSNQANGTIETKSQDFLRRRLATLGESCGGYQKRVGPCSRAKRFTNSTEKSTHFGSKFTRRKVANVVPSKFLCPRQPRLTPRTQR